MMNAVAEDRDAVLGAIREKFSRLPEEEIARRLALWTPEERAEVRAVLASVEADADDSFASWLKRVSPLWTWDKPHLKLIRERTEAAAEKRSGRLMIFCPPRHGKSEQTTIRFPVWQMEQDPDTRVCVGCYNQYFSEKFGRRSRRLAESRGIVSRDRAAAKEWETREGEGAYRSCGVGSPPMGEGFNLIVIDDPVKSRQEAESDEYRERAWEWYGDLYTRLEPGASMLLITTRWHEDDLAGRLIAEMETGGEQWEVLNLPALAEEGDPIGRKPGEALWPERYSVSDLNRIHATYGDYAFQALYQGRPSAREGALFKIHQFGIVDTAPSCVHKVRAWDLAATAGGGDYSCGVLMGRTDAGRFVVLDVVMGQWSPEDRNHVMQITTTTDGAAVRIAQDPGQAGKEQVKSLTSMLAGNVVKSERVTGDKVTRADPFASQVNVGNVDIVKADWNRSYLAQMRTFPFGKHDDAVDASSDAFAELAASAPWEFY